MHVTFMAIPLRPMMLNGGNAVSGFGLPEAAHPSPAAGAAQLHAPL